MTIHITVDFHNGLSLPDKQVTGWTELQIEKSLNQESTLELNIGSELIITAFRYWAKEKSLKAGYITLQYSNEIIGHIDTDGNLIGLHADNDTLNNFLIALL
jgi:hypothetical protein